MPEPPGEAEPPRAPRAAPLVPGEDERRERGQVVGVGGVAKAEQQRHREREDQRAAGADVRDPIVEAEHAQVLAAAIAACP